MTRRILKAVGGAMLVGSAALLACNPAALTRGGDVLTLGSPAQAADIRISFFYNRLDPHGSWVSHPRHGNVFVPAVRAGWRPYTNGHWVYTDQHGWYWMSEEPFAWAVYHYGRWGYEPAYGWHWVPGNVWAPAWVTWRHGGGNVGWAPIGPHGDGYVYGTPDYYDPPIVEAWVFVPERRFVAVNVAQYVAPIVEINLFLGKSRERHHVRYRDGRAYNPFLPRERVTKIVNQEINVYNITNVQDPDQASSAQVKENEKTIQAFQAEISEEQPQEEPKKVARTPDEVKSKPTLEETAKGEKPKDAPPSAAELKPATQQSSDEEKKADSKDDAKKESAGTTGDGDGQQEQTGRKAPENGGKGGEKAAAPETPEQKKSAREPEQEQPEKKQPQKGKAQEQSSPERGKEQAKQKPDTDRGKAGSRKQQKAKDRSKPAQTEPDAAKGRQSGGKPQQKAAPQKPQGSAPGKQTAPARKAPPKAAPQARSPQPKAPPRAAPQARSPQPSAPAPGNAAPKPGKGGGQANAQQGNGGRKKPE